MSLKNKLVQIKEQFIEDLPVVIASAITIGTGLFLYNRMIKTGLVVPKQDLEFMKNEREIGIYNYYGDQYTMRYTGKSI